MAVGKHLVYRGRHVKAEFELNRKGIKALANGPELTAATLLAAAHAKIIAEGLSQSFRDSGNYSQSFATETVHVTPKTAGDRWPMRRVAGRLINTAVYAAVVEVGGSDPRQPAHHVLLNTLLKLDATHGGRP